MDQSPFFVAQEQNRRSRWHVGRDFVAQGARLLHRIAEIVAEQDHSAHLAGPNRCSERGGKGASFESEHPGRGAAADVIRAGALLHGRHDSPPHFRKVNRCAERWCPDSRIEGCRDSRSRSPTFPSPRTDKARSRARSRALRSRRAAPGHPFARPRPS